MVLIGKVHGRQINLSSDPMLPEGARVEVEIRNLDLAQKQRQPLTGEELRKAVRDLRGKYPGHTPSDEFAAEKRWEAENLE